jgi:hypothetical protein
MATTQEIINLKAEIEGLKKRIEEGVFETLEIEIRKQITANTILLNTLLQQQSSSSQGMCDRIVLCDVV